MRYGLPYQGSKSKLAERIVALLPEAEHLYDLFAGGCAVTHCAMTVSNGPFGKWRHIHANDIADMPQLFRAAISGKYRDERRWISREDFHRLKASDPYVRSVWSFGNKGMDYLYSRELEPYKKALHEMLFAETVQQRRVLYRKVVQLLHDQLGKASPASLQSLESLQRLQRLQSLERLQSLQSLERLQSLQSLQRLQRLQSLQSLGSLQSLESLQSLQRLQRLQSLQSLGSLQSLESLETTQLDYREVEIKPDSVIYADPPYRGTEKYGKAGFDHEAFYDWCEQQTAPLFISEYQMPEDRFTCIAEWSRVSSLCATNNSLRVTERIYRPNTQLR